MLLAVLLLPVELSAQSRRDKEQTYVLDQPYEVTKITPPQGKKIKNVILMIGDGMSLMHVYSAWTANRGKLFLDNCQVVGLSKTYCANKLITDSGAGGTAIATGQKTNYHSVGVDTEGRPLKSLVDLAAAKGKSTGIAVTCRLWDATPADFCCHNKDRDAEAEIVADYVNCSADYVFGGGAKLFENREDGRDLFKELRDKGFQTPRSWDELAGIKSGKVFAVPYPVDTPLPAERGDLLARASLKGIELLDQNKNGFFMMIEGSQLDTELMLVIRSKEVNKQLEDGMMEYESVSRQVLDDGTYYDPYHVKPIELTEKHKRKVFLVQHLLGWARDLF